MSKLEELFLSKKELEKKKKDLMADAGGGGGAGGGGAGAGGGAGSGAGAGSGGGAGPGNSSGGGAHGNSSGGGGSAGSGDTGSADSTPSAPASNFFIGSMSPYKGKKKKKKKKNFKFGDGIYEALLEDREVSDKHFDRNELPQIKQKHLIDSSFDYTFKEMDLKDIKPVQSQRVKGLVQSSEILMLRNEYKPLIVDQDGYLVNGHHRYDAAHNLEMDKVNVIEINAGIDDLAGHFNDLVSNRKVDEAVQGDLNTLEDFTTYDVYDYGKGNINPIDVIRLFVKPNAQMFFLSGLRLSPEFKNPEVNKSPGILLLRQNMTKIGWGDHKMITAPNSVRQELPPAGQKDLFDLGDNDDQNRARDQESHGNYQVLDKSDLRRTSEIGKQIFLPLTAILGYLNSLEQAHPEYQGILNKIAEKNASNVYSRKEAIRVGLKQRRDPDVIEFNRFKDRFEMFGDALRTQIPLLAKGLYFAKAKLVAMGKNQYEERSLDNLDEYLTDILGEKIERNLKANKENK